MTLPLADWPTATVPKATVLDETMSEPAAALLPEFIAIDPEQPLRLRLAKSASARPDALRKESWVRVLKRREMRTKVIIAGYLCHKVYPQLVLLQTVQRLLSVDDDDTKVISLLLQILSLLSRKSRSKLRPKGVMYVTDDLRCGDPHQEKTARDSATENQAADQGLSEYRS